MFRRPSGGVSAVPGAVLSRPDPDSLSTKYLTVLTLINFLHASNRVGDYGVRHLWPHACHCSLVDREIVNQAAL
jgi:hypothetical protein